MKQLYLSVALLIAAATAQAQCVQAAFSHSLPCAPNTVSFTNTSQNATSYAWDFCPGELNLSALTTGLIQNEDTIGGLAYCTRAVFDGSNYFVFAANRNTNTLYRLNYGNTFNHAPDSTSMFVNTQLGSLLSQPVAIDVVQEGANWFLLVANNNNNTLVRISFGSNIGGAVSGSALVSVPAGTFNTPRAVQHIIDSNGDLIVAVTNNTTARVRLLNFHSSVTNNITAADTLSLGGLTGLANVWGFTIIKVCDRYVAFVSSTAGNALCRVHLGTVVFDTNFSVDAFTVAGANTHALQLVREGNAYKLFLSTYGSTSRLFFLNFGNSPEGAIPAATQFLLGSGSSIHEASVQNEGSRWYVFYADETSGTISKILFPQTGCSASPAYATTQDVSAVNYTPNTAQTAVLTATDAQGNGSDTAIAFFYGSQPTPKLALGWLP